MEDYLKRFWGSIIFYGSLSLVALFSIFKIDNSLFIYAMIPIILIAILGLIQNIIMFKKVSLYGKVRVQYTNATPVDTMLQAVMRCNYNISQIKKILFVGNDLKKSCDYLNKSKAISILKDKNPSVAIEIVGSGDITQEYCNDIKINKSKKVTSEHKNILTMDDGKKFLWYEANHTTDKKGKDIFIDGVYFIELTDEKATELEDDYEALKVA